VSAVTIRPVAATDYAAWLPLWRGYCAALDGDVSQATTDATWRRILAPDEPLACLAACTPEGSVVGMAVYHLHANTWSEKPVCYLEDLFVAPEARGSGAARALIDHLVILGRAQGWHRVYWHTTERNYRARALYDRVAKRTDHVRYDIEL
jgi:GNAT superfamily N-acetyltransferase